MNIAIPCTPLDAKLCRILNKVPFKQNTLSAPSPQECYSVARNDRAQKYFYSKDECATRLPMHNQGKPPVDMAQVGSPTCRRIRP